MDRTIPRFIPPMPNTSDQNRCKDQSDHHTVPATIHPSGNVLPQKDTASRPCAIIGPDGIVPQYHKIEGYPSHVWPQARNGAVSYYRTAPSQFYTEQMYPPRNISPRHTFQENMSRIVVPSPTETKLRSEGYLPNNLQNSNFVLPNSAKRNISPSVKFCEGAVLVSPHSVEVLRPQYHKNGELPVGRHDIQGPQLTPHGVPLSNVHEIPYTHPNNLYAYSADYQRYPHEYKTHGIHMVKNNAAYQTYSEPQSPYYIGNDYSGNTYARVNNIRYEPYPQVKDKYIHTRYEYPYQIQSEYPSPQGVSQKLHETKKKAMPQSADMRCYQLPQKYVETHPYVTNPEYRTKISNRRNPNGVPYHVANYPAERYTNQAKIFEFNIYDKNSQIAGNPRPVAESTKIKIDYYNHCKALPYSDAHYNYENSHNLSKSNMPIYNYPMKPPEVHHSYTVNGNYQRPIETHIDSDINHQKVYYNQKYSTYNPLAKIPTEFSPNIISPTDSNASFDSQNTVSHQQYQEDGGYVSQCSTASGQSNDYQLNANGKNYDRVYNTMPMRPVNPFTAGCIPQNTNTVEVKQVKPQNLNKCSIDLRQFVETWDEEFEDQTQPKPLSETIAHKNVDVIPLETNSLLTSEELYVLDKVTISKDDLHKYEHLQKVTKLPDNIKDYEHIENAKRNKFTKDMSGHEMEQTRLTDKLDYFYNYNQNGGVGKSKGPRVEIIKSHTSMNEPIDVESKISQSIIHKEVGCNFEIKPCSPAKQDQMSSTGEQKIDKEKRDCNLNDRNKKSYNDHRNVNIHVVPDNERNAKIKEITHSINFCNDNKSSISKNLQDDDHMRVEKNRLQLIGSSLPQIGSDMRIERNLSSNSISNNLAGTYSWNLENNRNRSICPQTLNVLDDCRQSERKQTVVPKIENIKTVKDEEVQILLSHQNDQKDASDIFLNKSFLNMSEKYRSTNSIEHLMENSDITKVKLEHTPVKFVSKPRYEENCMFNEYNGFRGNGNTPSVIKTNYGRKSTSFIDQVVIDSNKLSVPISMEQTVDSTENSAMKPVFDLEKVNVTSQLNDIAQLHIPDISENIKDTNQLNKIPVSAEIFSNADSSKIIHTTLECVIEAIESSIDDGLKDNRENFNSDTVDSVDYPNLAIDYSNASLKYKSVKNSHDNVDNLASAVINNIQSNITDEHLIPIVEEKSDETSSNTALLIKPKLIVVEKYECLSRENQIAQTSPHESEIENLPQQQEISLCEAVNTCNVEMFQVSESDLNSHKDNMSHLKSSTENSSIDLPVLQTDELLCPKINSRNILSKNLDIIQDLRIKDHLCPEIISTDINHEPPVSTFNTESLPEAVVIDLSDAPILGDGETLGSNLQESIVTDSIENTTLSKFEDDINKPLNYSGSADLTMLENHEKNVLKDDIGSKNQECEIKCQIFHEIDSDQTLNTTAEGEKVIDYKSSQLVLDNTSKLTPTNDPQYLVSSASVSIKTGNSNNICDKILDATGSSLLQSSLYDSAENKQDAQDARIDSSMDESKSVENDDISVAIPSSSSEMNQSVENTDESKLSEIEKNLLMGNIKDVLDIRDESVEINIGLISMVAENDACHDQVCTDVFTCCNLDSKSQDCNVVDPLTLATTFIEEINADKTSVIIDESESCETQNSSSASNLEIVKINSSQDSNNPTLNKSSPISLLNKTSNNDDFEENPIELSVEVSKIEHDGLELGGCWIDDIACVETVVSEEDNFPHEIPETRINSNQSWDPNSSDDDDSVSHMLHYHIDSVGNILKDTNGNVILTNPFFEMSNSHKKKIKGQNKDGITKTEKNEDLRETRKLQVVSPTIAIPLSKDSHSKHTFKELEILERQKRKTSMYNSEPKKERSRKKRRKQVIELEFNDSKHKSVRKIDSDEKKHNTENSEKHLFKSIQSNHYSDGRILTKGAQKYIPPIAADDLKVHLPLPEKKLLSLKLSSRSHKSDLKKSSINSKEHSSNIKRMVLPKKPPKQKFEDVLKNIDISTMTCSKKRSLKIKQTVPKMVIKKNKHGSHYASVNTEKMSAPDMTGNKWQPFVSIPRIACIENMIKTKESQTVYFNVFCSPAEVYRSSLCSMLGERESTQHHDKHKTLCIKDSVI